MPDPSFIEELEHIVGAGNVRADEPLRAHTSFKIGGPADYLVVPADLKQARAAMAACRAAGAPFRILGHGTNVLVSDAGVRGVVIQLSGNVAEVEVEGCVVRATAGTSNARIAAAACAAGLAGYEFAAGIPGTLGGAAVMNAGAYGGEFRDVATSVECLDRSGRLVRLSAEEAGWGYRSSRIADEGMIVLSAELELSPGDPREIQARMDDLAARRREKQPLELPSAGSAFKRPEGDFAARLIQEAGMQGYRVGGAEVSGKHAGFIVNRSGATAADVRAVIEAVRSAVNDRFGILLQPEIRFWGFDEEV